MTLAICSSPCVNLMSSTAVSIVGKRAQHVLDRHARRERRVALRIEGLGLRHAAGHPQHDDRIGGGASAPVWRPARSSGSRPASAASVAAGGRAHEAAAARRAR